MLQSYLPVTPHPSSPSCKRNLQLFDSRRVNKYKDTLLEQLSYHSIMEKCKALYSTASSKQWTEDLSDQYEKLDKLITESVLYVERQSSKKYTKRFEWSPALVQTIESVCYWCLLLKRAKGLSIAASTLTSVREREKNSPLDTDSLDLPVIVKNLRMAIQQMRLSQRSQIELREAYL
jgi:hypothetical protein